MKSSNGKVFSRFTVAVVVAVGLLAMLNPIPDGEAQIFRRARQRNQAANHARHQVRNAQRAYDQSQKQAEAEWMNHFISSQPQQQCVNGVCTTVYPQPQQQCVNGVCTTVYPQQWVEPYPVASYSQPVVQKAQAVEKPVYIEKVVEKPVYIDRVQQSAAIPANRELTADIVESRVREEMRGSKGFKKAVRQAIKQARQGGQISAKQALRLQVAMMAPSFARQAETMAITQLTFEGEEAENGSFQFDEDGKIIEAQINWEGLISFVQVFIPLLIDLLTQFGLGG